MTPVIARRPSAFYPAVMTMPLPEDLERLAAMERSVSARLDAVDGNPANVLDAGAEVLAFADLEERLFFPILPLLDPLAAAELEQEHHQLADDLQLLHHLIAATPDSPDVGTLASALARRLRSHIARDGRLIAQGLRLAAARM